MDFDEILQMKFMVAQEIDRLQERLLEMSASIHANPEIAFQEHRSMALLADAVEKAGYTVERNVAGLQTAFKAVYSGCEQGPTIAFLAEYDALPGLGHACGHNIIGTSAIGAALAIRSVMDRLPGRIAVLGTPAEEGGGGKIIMIEKGAFADVDIAMLVHPSDQTRTRRISLAARSFKMEFYGHASHASTSPEQGINALDACIQTFNSINALRQHVPSDVRIHGIITHGGDAVNVVPEYVVAEFMVRALKIIEMRRIADKLLCCAEASAKAMGAKVVITPKLEYANMIPNHTIADLYARNITELGETVIEAQPHEKKASSDMGNVSHILPTIGPHIQIAPKGTSGHTPEFRDAAISKWGNEGLLKAAKALAMTAVDLFTNPETVELARMEFKNQMTINTK